MTLDEVMRIEDASERLRAFSRLPASEQDGLFTPEELAARSATEELYDKYLKVAQQAFSEFGRVLRHGDAEDVLMLVLRVQAANELRSELIGLSRPTLDSTFGAKGSPFPLFNRAAIAVHRQQIRREVMT